MAEYLYRSLGGMALSAGVEVGDELNDRAAGMLRCWGIDATGHRPRRLTRELCDAAGAIFAMGPLYLGRLLAEHGWDLAGKCYLFADPFSRPGRVRGGGVPGPRSLLRPASTRRADSRVRLVP